MTKRIEPLGFFFKKITKTNLLACGDPPSLRWSRGPQRNLLGECLRGYTNLNGPRILAKFCKSKSDSEPDSDESSPSNRLFDEFAELLRDDEPEAEPVTRVSHLLIVKNYRKCPKLPKMDTNAPRIHWPIQIKKATNNLEIRYYVTIFGRLDTMNFS